MFIKKNKQIILMVLVVIFNTSLIWALDDTVLETISPVKYYDPASGEQSSFFPLEWMHFGPAVDLGRLQSIADSGANTVRLSDCGTDAWHWQYVQHNLNWAQQLGMKVVIGLSPNLISGVDANNPSSYTTFASFIDSYKSHPALLGWQIGDEISTNPTTSSLYNDTINAAQIIKARDPNRQIWQLHGLTSNDNITQYMVGTDASASDMYQCVVGESEFQEGRCSYLLNYFLGRGILNGTNGWAGNVNVTQAAGTAHDAALRFPTPGEYRWNVYSGLASAGNRGIANWAYTPELYPGGEFANFTNNAVKPVFSELNKMSHAMETGWNVGSVGMDWDKKNQDATNWTNNFKRISELLVYDDYKRKYFLIVTNNATESQGITATLSNLPTYLRNKTATVSGSSQTVTFTDNGGGSFGLADNVAGFGVKLYEINDYVKGVYNGKMNGADGWELTGNAQYSTDSKDSDGSGSILVYGSHWGDDSNQAVQWMGVDKYTRYSVRWSAKAGGNGRYSGYSLTDMDGNPIDSASPVGVDGVWSDYLVKFDNTTDELTYLNLKSYSTDWVRFDNIIMAPHAFENNKIDGSQGWELVGTANYNAGISKDAGTGSLYLWADGWGSPSGQAKQLMGVDQNTNYMIRWVARAGGDGRYYGYDITDENGNVVQSAPVISANGTWGQTLMKFNSGCNDFLNMSFNSYSVDWVAIDDVIMVQENEVYNGHINDTIGWENTTTADLFGISKSDDGTGSLKVWADSWGSDSGVWSQIIAVGAGQTHQVNWSAIAGGDGRYFMYSILDENGNVIDESLTPIGVGGLWQDYSVMFNTGSNDFITFNLKSYSTDWVAFDEIEMVPEPATMGLLTIGGLLVLIRRKKGVICSLPGE